MNAVHTQDGDTIQAILDVINMHPGNSVRAFRVHCLFEGPSAVVCPIRLENADIIIGHV